MKKVLFWALILILLGVFCFSAWRLGAYIVESLQVSSTYKELQELMEQNRPSRPLPQVTDPSVEPIPGETVPQPTEGTELVTVTDPNSGLQIQVLPEFAPLYVRNTDLVGWVEIPGTNICYPVLHRPADRDYYLRKDFYGKYATHGCIYVREVCDVVTPSDNVTVYGHRMSDGSMFYDLLKYDEKSYFEDHRYILFDTLTQRHTYEVIAAFQTTASIGEGFQYHMFVNAATEAEFDQFVSTCKKLAYYDTGVSASYGDKLITLATCDYTIENGRMVVVAKRID